MTADLKMATRLPQNGSKMKANRPRGPKVAPKWLPRWPQVALRSPGRNPKLAPFCLQVGPDVPQVDPTAYYYYYYYYTCVE